MDRLKYDGVRSPPLSAKELVWALCTSRSEHIIGRRGSANANSPKDPGGAGMKSLAYVVSPEA